MKWPLLWPLLLYVTGILLGTIVHVWPFLLLGVSLGVVVVGLAWGRARPALLYAIMLLAGWTNYTLHTAIVSPNDLRRLVGAEPRLATVRGRIVETPTLRVYEFVEPPSWRTMARIEVSALRFDKEDWRPATGRVAVATPGTLTNLFGGQTVEVFGVLGVPKGPVAEGVFDYRAFLAEQGVYYRLQADFEYDWKVLRSPKKAPLADRFRTWGRQMLARGLPGEDESLRLEWALTLGWKTALDERSSEPFIRAATYHIFAVDGLRMAILFGILFGLLRACHVPRAICGVMLLPLLWFYVALTGWPASAIRATVMLSLIILGWALRRPTNLINSLLAAAIIILVWDSQQLFQAGFQLSFLVVLCMILILRPLVAWVHRLFEPDPLLPVALRRRWPGFVRVPVAYIGDLFFTSLAAWLGSIPLVAYYFNIITPVSTPANILAVPLCALVLMSNLGSLLLVSWLPAAAELFNHAGWFLMECIRVTSIWFADWPLAWFYVSAPGLYTTCLYYALLFAVVTGWLWKPAFRPVKLGVAGLAIAVWCVLLTPELFRSRVTILPANGGIVMYADAPGTRSDLLIDTGNTNAVHFIVKPALRAQGVNTVHNLVLSHGDLKHIGGARVLSELLPVKRVWTSPVRFRSAAYRRLVSHFGATPGHVDTLARPEWLGSWEVLHPGPDDRFSKADDGTLVLRGEVKGTRLMVVGDLGKAGQEALLAQAVNLRADILVTGLPTVGEPLCDPLLEAIRPQVLIVADSEFPAAERASQRVRQRLSRRTTPVIYTRDTGAVTIEFRNGRWEMRAMNGFRLKDER